METIIQKKLFSQDECDYFISISNDKSFERSKITEHVQFYNISEFRTSSEVVVEMDTNLFNLIFEKVKEFGIKSLPNQFIILRYNKNQEFKRHNDVGLDYPDRYKTLIVQLSNETDYEGGELCIFHNDEIITSSKEVGNVIMFDSSIDHLANKVKTGTRYSMVFWLSIDNFGLTKSLI